MDPKWIEWVKSIRGIAQAGLTYCDNPFDIERYTKLLAISADILSNHTSLNLNDAIAEFENHIGYETPKIDVRGVVFRDDAILLVKEISDNGRWTLPGGWADGNDFPHEAVEREVREESGYLTKATKLLAVYDRRLHGHQPASAYGIYKLFFRCELLGGAPAESIETTSAAFFQANRIPDLSISRVTPEEISRMFQHLRNPNLPTDFD
jgi:ADP-ribose pyrophosphatase YjhB (NUDIX family)